MKFVQRDMGEAVEASSGGGPGGLFKEIGTLVLCFAGLLAFLHFSLVGIAGFLVQRVSMEDEQILFSSMGGISEWEPGEAYGEKVAMAERAMERLMAAPAAPPVKLRLTYSDAPEANAFAYPGGVIILTRGLLDAYDNEAQVAFVLAHEIGHFVGRHHLKTMSRAVGSQIALGIIFQGVSGAHFAGMGDQMLQLSYSRKQEEEADDYGILLAREAYGNSEDFAVMMEKLLSGQHLPDWAYPFSTHPNSKARIQKLKDRAGDGAPDFFSGGEAGTR